MSEDKLAPIEVPVNTIPKTEWTDTTPKNWRVKGKHKPGAWVVFLGAGGNSEEAEAYRRNYDAIEWGRKDPPPAEHEKDKKE